LAADLRQVSDEERVHDDDERHRRWLEGCRREMAICELLKRHEDSSRLPTSDVADVARELGVSRATLYRLIAAYRAKRTVQAVEPRTRGRLYIVWQHDSCYKRISIATPLFAASIIAATARVFSNPSRPVARTGFPSTMASTK
jgi:transposase-like protein